MAEHERTILAQYNLHNAYPVEWPAELDDSEEEDEIDGVGVRRSRSRYSALERSAGDRRTIIPDSQRTRDGRANLVLKDEKDPLTGKGSVLDALISRNLPVKDDPRLRNRFMLSSTTFSPALYLSQTHYADSTEDLQNGLRFLEISIDQKSASLKSLVETNFERFVRAKSTIDNVYTEMRNQGVDPTVSLPTSPRHSRHVSRNSTFGYRTSSGTSVTGPAAPPPTVSKNSLRKETEYGVQAIKIPLLEVSQKAEDVWGPALGGKERETSLKAIVEAVEKDRVLYELGSNLRQSIKQKDYEKSVEYYNLARGYANQVRTIGDRALQNSQTLSDEQVHKILVTGRMWTDVEEQVKNLKRDIWRRLSTVQTVLPLPGASRVEEHMELIGVLLELGVDDNPIWVWLLSRYDYLKNKISAVVERSRIEIEILRRRLATSEPPTLQNTAVFLRLAGKDHVDALDTEQVVQFWNTIMTYLTKLCSISSGLLGEVIDFWDSAQSFIEGNKQKSLPTGFDGQSRKHHRLSDAGVKDLRNGAVELVNLIRDAVCALFVDPPTEDISALLSPNPNSAKSPATPLSAVAFSPTEGRLGRIDPQNLPAPSPKRGEMWEGFGFWPPHSNCISAVHYLGKLLGMVATAAGEMAVLEPVAQNSNVYDKVKTMIAIARERCMRMVCEAWSKDAEKCKGLEDWLRAPERRDQTRMPLYFEAFERRVLNGTQQVMYLSEAITKRGSRDVVTPPPSKLLMMVRTQFVSSIYKAVSGMLENAESYTNDDGGDWVVKSTLDPDLPSETSDDALFSDHIVASSRTVRMLLTLSNLKALRNEYVPQLISLFESSFSVKLTDESKTIRDVFGQIDAKLFHSYTKPTVVGLIKMIQDGINAPDWAPANTKPVQARPYVYSVLMVLVTVHTEVSTTVSSMGASGSLLGEILSYLLENICQALLDGFKDRKPNTYTLPALMQATFDTEFIAQNMSQYATEKVGAIQGQIYVELDKRTTNEARVRLQQELVDMKVVLKRLREQSRSSFGCFKKQRPGEKDRGRPDRKLTGA